MKLFFSFLFALFLLLLLPSFLLAQAPGAVKAEYFVDVTADTVFAGECFVVTGYLLIHRDNTAALNFSSDLNEQIQSVHKALFELGAYKFDNNIESIYREDFKNGRYAAYRLFGTSLCPASPGVYNIPGFKLKLLQYVDSATPKEIFLNSTEASVVVQELPERVADISEDSFGDGPLLVGDFELKEQAAGRKTYSTGDTISYTLTISGKGNVFTAFPKKYFDEGIQVIVNNISYSDTIQYDEFTSKKVMDISLVPSKAGSLRVGDYLSWTAFSPAQNSYYSLASEETFQVRETGVAKNLEECKWPGGVIVLDISASMKIVDYAPSRLAFCREFVNAWRQNSCTSAMVVFDGEANYFYEPISIGRINALRHSPGGSSLGDAILLGVELLKSLPEVERNLLVFSDGESNAGNIHYKAAAALAKKNRIKIYSFGFGYDIKVPRTNRKGESVLLNNIFNFEPLKEISEITDGQFYWVRKEDVLSEVPVIQELK